MGGEALVREADPYGRRTGSGGNLNPHRLVRLLSRLLGLVLLHKNKSARRCTFFSTESFRLSQTFREICATGVEDDGVTFELDSIQGEQIRAHEEYVGLRIELRAILGGAVVRVQVDIGIGDAVRPSEITLPTLLDFPQPFLRAYTRENSLAEKFETMVKLGFINTRMKDYFDFWHLSRNFAFNGEEFGETLRATFERRGTPIPSVIPVGLSSEYWSDKTKQLQRRAFCKKSVRREPVPELQEVVKAVEEFVMPVVRSVAGQTPSPLGWPPSGPWSYS